MPFLPISGTIGQENANNIQRVIKGKISNLKRITGFSMKFSKVANVTPPGLGTCNPFLGGHLFSWCPFIHSVPRSQIYNHGNNGLSSLSWLPFPAVHMRPIESQALSFREELI